MSTHPHPNLTRFLSPPTLALMTTPTTPHLPPPNPTPIHPLFLPPQFPTLPPATYNLLTPALHLASSLLLSPPSLSFFLPVLFSPTVPLPPSTHPHPPTHYLLPLPSTRANISLVHHHLTHHHPPHLKFSFRPEAPHAAFSSCHFHPGRPSTTLIYLDTGYLSLLPQTPHMPAAQFQSFHLHVATLMLHELAHSVFMVRPAQGPRIPLSLQPAPEPRHSLHGREVDAELGSSYEVALFGGKVQPANMEMGCAEGLVWYEWIGNREVVREVWGVGMGWVEGVWRGEVEVGLGGGGMVVGEGPALVPFSEAGWRRREVSGVEEGERVLPSVGGGGKDMIGWS